MDYLSNVNGANPVRERAVCVEEKPIYLLNSADQRAVLERLLLHAFEIDVGNRSRIVDGKTVYIFESPA